MSESLSLTSSARLSSGYTIPMLGLGVSHAEDCTKACLAALEHGYRHIDSARFYANEKEVGQAVRESGIPREEVFVTSKVMSNEHGYESTLAVVDDSLKNFGFDYLDLFLIHSALSGKQTRLDTWRALLDAKKAGKLRTVGVSNYGVHHLQEIREAGLEAPAVNQVEVRTLCGPSPLRPFDTLGFSRQLHPFCQQKSIVEYCKKHNIFVEAYCPLIRGKNFDNPVLVEVAKKYNKSIAQILVRWSLQHGFIPLPKSSQPARIVSNADLYDFEISPEDMAKIDALDRGKEGSVSWNPVDAL